MQTLHIQDPQIIMSFSTRKVGTNYCYTCIVSSSGKKELLYNEEPTCFTTDWF